MHRSVVLSEGIDSSNVETKCSRSVPPAAYKLMHTAKKAGYKTAITGKWHLGNFRPEYLPTRRG